MSIPANVEKALPETQRGGPVEELKDGRYIAVGPDALMVVKDGTVVDSGLWHEIQFASWEAQTKQFRVVWVDEDRPSIVGETLSEDPEWLMRKITSFVNKTIVTTRTLQASSGGFVAASVRTRPDGQMFSTVVVSGAVSDQEIERGLEMEKALREELGI